MPSFLNYRWPDVARMLAVALIYIALIKLTFVYISPQNDASIIWLPSGVGLGVLLIWGKRYWPSIFAGVLTAYVLVLGWPFLSSAAIALCSSSMEPLLGVWLLSLIRHRDRPFDATLEDPSDFVMLSAVAVISSWAAAMTGCLLLIAFGIHHWNAFLSDLMHWWMGNLIGIILVTPLILIWRKLPSDWFDTPGRVMEYAAFLGLAFILGQVVFMDWLHSFFSNIASNYWVFAFVCWAAVRFGLHGMLIIIFMTAIQALAGADLGLGVFKDDYSQSHLVNFWFYMLTLTLVGMLLSGVIQKRRQSETLLADSERRWKYALEAAGDGVWDWNLQAGEMLYSSNWKEMLGYADEEIANSIGEWESRIHPQDREGMLADLNAHLSGNSPAYVNEHRMCCKDGSWKWILARGMVFSRSGDGRPLRMVGMHTDITRHKELERALKQDEEDLQTIFAQSPDGIVVFDRTHAVSHVNEAFCWIAGLDSDQLFGRTEFEFDAMMQHLCGDAIQYPATANQLNPVSVIFSIKPGARPARGVYERGEQIEIFIPEHRMLMRSLIELDQRRLSRVMYFRDITAETEVDRMKSEFLSTAAHELRTPMSIILGYAELLKLKSFDKATEDRMLESIHDQSLSIVALLNELLDLARIEARAGKAFNMELAPLAPVIKNLADTFIMAGDARRVKLLPMPALPDLLIDPEKIGQALKNCLSNAFKFSSGDSEVSMEASVVENAGKQQVAITIRDHGIGMSPQQLARVFEKFYRADASGKIPGTGLGMSLIKEIIEHHGGMVQVESHPGQGTVVTLMLPVVQNQKEETAI